MKFSVIVPARNEAAFIDSCPESIKQKFNQVLNDDMLLPTGK
jgi:glycosyltransferase involved in cell wall biosynthesis